MSERKYKVYKHTCVYNGKIYIGITNNTNVERRWLRGSGYKNNEHFWRAIQKYGWDDGFTHEVVYDNLSKDDAEDIEKKLISFYHSNDKNFGYNLQSGGGVNYTLSEDGCRHISESKKGKTSIAIKEGAKRRGLRMGENIAQIDFCGNLVKVWPSAQMVENEMGYCASTIRKCCKKSDNKRRTANGFIWMSYKDFLVWNGDTSYWLKNKHDSYEKKVAQINSDGEIVNVYKSQSEASRITGIPSQNISLCCYNERLTAGGYKWEFV